MNPTTTNMSDNTTSSAAPLAAPSSDATTKPSNGAGYQRPANIGGARDGRLINVEPPRREDLQPSYAQNLVGESEQGTHGWYGSMINTLGNCIGTFGAIPCCIICPNPYKPVSQGNVGLVTKFGRFYRAVDPGLVKINPLSERLIQVDVKIQIVGTSLLLLPPPFFVKIPGFPFKDVRIQLINPPQRSPNRSA